MARRTRAKRPPEWEMEVDEVQLGAGWTVRVITPSQGNYQLCFKMDHHEHFRMPLATGDLFDVREGFLALSEVLEKAQEVDDAELVPRGWRCPECGMVFAPHVDVCPCSVEKVSEKAQETRDQLGHMTPAEYSELECLRAEDDEHRILDLERLKAEAAAEAEVRHDLDAGLEKGSREWCEMMEACHPGADGLKQDEEEGES